jgi:hypothetical protein
MGFPLFVGGQARVEGERRPLGSDDVEQEQSREHRREADEPDLAIAHLGKPFERIAPEARHEERQHAFDHEHERKGREQRVTHGRPGVLRERPLTRYFAGLPPDLRYLKNSEFGSSTSTSFLPLKLCL